MLKWSKNDVMLSGLGKIYTQIEGGKKKEKGQVWCQQLFLVNCSFVMIKKAIKGEKESWKYTQLVLAFKIKKEGLQMKRYLCHTPWFFYHCLSISASKPMQGKNDKHGDHRQQTGMS